MRSEKKRRQVWIRFGTAAAGAVLLVGFGSSRVGRAAGQAKAEAERFDLEVREDIFKGFTGDAAALERGLKKCEDALAKDPKNAEALVWHGAGLGYRIKAAFMAGDVALGRQLQAQSAKEMNDAVALRPDDVAVLIPRAASLLAAAARVPSPEVAKRNYGLAATDYERVLQLQATYFSKLPVHSRGELLGGLAEAWHGLGDDSKAKSYLARMVKELPDTMYARRAADLLAGAGKAGALGATCLGCHIRASDN